jgi:hypothetical protein
MEKKESMKVEQIYVEIDGLLIPLDMERVNKDWLNTLEKQLC